jgi:hypothetical protein
MNLQSRLWDILSSQDSDVESSNLITDEFNQVSNCILSNYHCLQFALNNNKYLCASKLLKIGANVNYTYFPTGNSLLMSLCFCKRPIEHIYFYLNNGAMTSIKNNDGKTCFDTEYAKIISDYCGLIRPTPKEPKEPKDKQKLSINEQIYSHSLNSSIVKRLIEINADTCDWNKLIMKAAKELTTENFDEFTKKYSKHFEAIIDEIDFNTLSIFSNTYIFIITGLSCINLFKNPSFIPFLQNNPKYIDNVAWTLYSNEEVQEIFQVVSLDIN